MFPSHRDMSNSSTSSVLLRAKRFGIFSIFAITANIFTIPIAAYSQIAVDGSTETEVNGNIISPTGAGTVNGGNLYNSFDQFNVPNTGVIFNTGTSSVDGNKVDNIINRVTGDSPSSILGTIESRQAFPNANLFLLNPNGVVFSSNAKLDIGGSFNVSTGTGLGFDQNQKFIVDKNSLSFPSGDPKNIQFAVSQPAGIINQGNLNVDAGKNIAITAGTVINTGNLSAPQGNIGIATVAGNSQVELRSPDLILGLSVSKNTIPTTWNGQIATLPKLAEALTGKASEANQVVVKPDGSIALVTNPNSSDIAVKEGMAIASGDINVDSTSGKGGNIGIFGNQVGLVNAQVNASGATGGGNVLIGGDFQGKGIAPNALQTYINASSKILANGLLTGDGGRVIIWADRSTQFLGAIAARGGEISGNGGFVEVSGKENLTYRGDTDTRAINGAIGTLLLDPTNINVVDSGISSLIEVSTFNNNPAIGSANISSSLISGANSNVVLQATDTITIATAINITNSGISLTAQAGNSIFVGSSITTNGGDVNLIGNDPSNATGLGNITVNSPITTNGGAINIQIDNAAGLFINGDLDSDDGNITLRATGSSGVSIGGFGVSISSEEGNILINGSSTTGQGIFISGFNSSITSDEGSVTLTGISSSGNISSGSGIVIVGGSTIKADEGIINISGFSDNVTGGSDGVVVESVFGGNSTTISTSSGNINIVGNAVNPLNRGINIRAPFTGGDLILNSGSGNFNFTSDRTELPSIGLEGNGAISLRAFSPNAALTIGGNNVFLSNSFLTSLANSPSFSNVKIGDVADNNAINVAQAVTINTINSAPVEILTASTFNANGFAINTNGSSFSLTANQDINALGNIFSDGGNVSITSSLGNISSIPNSEISTFSLDFPTPDSGKISVTALNGSLNLQDFNTSAFEGFTSKAGDITLTVTGNNNISVRNIVASTFGNTTGNAGTVAFVMGNGVINLVGNNIDLSSQDGSSTDLIVNNPVVVNSPTFVDIDTGITISGLTVKTTGSTGSGNVTFNSTVTSPNASNVTINSGLGDVTFNNAIATNGQPLGNFTVNSSGTTTFANTVFANSISSNFGGNTIINADLVATGANGFINLGNFTANGTISLVGNEIDLNGLASGTGDLTLKTLTTTQAIAIGGSEDTGTSTLNILNSDLSAFVNGTFNSLTIDNLDGSGAIFLLGNVEFFQPTTIQSPVGNGSFSSNGFDVTGVGRLGIEVGNAIAINNSSFAPSVGNTLNVRLNADRDASGSGTIALNNSSINTGGQNITLGGGLNPVIDPAIATDNTAGVTINSSTLNAQGGNIFVNGRNTSTLGIGNDGILIEGNSLVRTTGTGSISIVGDTLSTGIDNRDVKISGSIIETLGTGAISIASSPNTPRLIQLINSSINPTAVGGSGTVTLESDEIDLLGSTQVRGTGNLVLQPATTALGITLGGSINDVNLNLSTDDLATIQDGFSQILIGRVDTAGQILLSDNIFLSDSITLRSQGISGSINTSGFDFTSTGAINFLANQNITTGNVTALGNNLTLSSSLGAVDTSQGLLNTSSIIGNGGDVSLLSPSINTNLGSINTSSTVGNAGNLSFSNISNGLITIAGSDINLSSDSGVAGSLNFLVPVVISNPNLTINTSSSSGTSGSVTFSNNLNGAIGGTPSNLILNAGTGSIFLNNSVTFDANGNLVATRGGFGTTTALQSLAIAPDSTLVSQVDSGFSTTDINITTIGDVNVGNIISNGRDVNVSSTDGLISTGNIDGSFTFSIGDGGNVKLSAKGNVTTGNIDTNSFGDAGAVNLESRSGVISTGDIDASGTSGGQVFFNAATSINAGQISTRGFEGAGGDVILDPSGDVVVASIETTGLTGGNVTLVSTGGNLKITDILDDDGLNICVGASICTSGSITSGTISLQTGGLNPFVVGDASINGSSGTLTTGQSTLTVGTSIPVLLDSTFSQNGIFITPGGFAPINPEPPITKKPTLVDLDNRLEPPKSLPALINQIPDEAKILSVRDVFISEADRYFREGNLEKAFEVIEKAYVSQLEVFTGNAIASEAITLENTQDLLSTVVQQTGDVAALIYPVLLNDRIEILVIPPKEKGKPFSRTSIATNQEQIETVITDYRNNLRDVGSNDYLEQSQQLYDWVIRPIKQQLEAMKVDTLVFVMDGGLRVTPPSALHDGEQFLIEKYAIASIPALRVTRIEERDRKATRVLAMGLTESVAGFSALPSVDIEIKTISSDILNGDAFLNQEFTVNNLQSQRQRGVYNILHLGTHAKFISDTSRDSFIQFWDSRLSLKDIPKLRFDSPVIDMLALSACQTAVGNNLGISGLAVESGARSVLASLWEVSDAGTAPLMISFYKAFPDAVNKAQAMKKAQIELLAGRVTFGNGQILGIEGIPNIPLPAGLADIDLKHPFYWSSFILVGNWL